MGRYRETSKDIFRQKESQFICLKQYRIAMYLLLMKSVSLTL